MEFATHCNYSLLIHAKWCVWKRPSTLRRRRNYKMNFLYVNTAQNFETESRKFHSVAQFLITLAHFIPISPFILLLPMILVRTQIRNRLGGKTGKFTCRKNKVKFGTSNKRIPLSIQLAMAKAASNKKRTIFTSTLDLELRKKLVKCYVWSIALYGAETWTLRAVDQKHLESFEMWCWRRMEKISLTDHVRNEDVLLRVNKQRNILHEIRKRKANWISLILCRNCLLKWVTEGKIQGG